MNWIDDKYKEKLGNKKFPDSLKEAGWAKAEKLLDKEMPVSSAGGLGISGKYLIALLAVITIPSAIWYFSQSSDLPADETTKAIPALNATDDQNVLDQTLDAPSTQDNNELNPKNGNIVNVDRGEVNDSPENIDDQNSSNTPLDQGVLAGADQGLVATSGGSNPGEVANADPDSNPENRGANIDVNISSVDGESGKSGNSIVNNQSGSNADNVKSAVDANGSATSQDPSLEKSGRTSDISAASGNTPAGAVDADNQKANSSLDPTDDVPNQLADQNQNGQIANSADNDKVEPSNDPVSKEDSQENVTEENSVDPTASEDVSSNEDNTNPEQKDDSTDDQEIETPDDNTATANSANSSRKQHLAFLDLPDEVSVADKYNFFSRERFSLSLWGGYTYTDKFLSASNSVYTDKRQAEEKAIWTSPTGVDLDYFLDGRWTVGLGFRWTEYGEDIQYNISNRDTAWIDGRTNDPSNFTNVVAVDSARIITGINQGHWNYVVVSETIDSAAILNNGRTSWQYVEIPLMLGYRFGQGSFRPWIKSGVSFGIPISTNFRYLNPEATQLNDLSLTHSKLVAPLQYNYLLDVGVDCYLTRNFSIRLNATSSVQLNSSLRQSTIKQRYYRLGLGIVIAYNF